jgi:hypothetical protein
LSNLCGLAWSAGTFATEKAADRAWQRAEARMAEGRMGNPSRGRQRFRTYVEQEWLPNHQMEARTRETYSYYLHRHILPWFGAPCGWSRSCPPTSGNGSLTFRTGTCQRT